MVYILLSDDNGKEEFGPRGKIPLRDEREPADLRSFQITVATMLNDTRPDVVGVKKKPHKGAMSAGPGAIKMEALLLYSATCDVKFFTPQHLARKVTFSEEGVFKYLEDAARAALAAK